MVIRAKALIIDGREDFGIALAEAQGGGTPVIAFERGGASDIVVPVGTCKQPTGILFKTQSAEAIRQAVDAFESQRSEISPLSCHANAKRFSVELFHQRINAAIDRALDLKRQQFAGGIDAV